MMLRILMRLLGKDPSVIPAGADIRFVWLHGPVSWQVFLLLGTLAVLWFAIGWFYRREAATCPRTVRLLLAVLRSLIVLAAVMIFLGPALGVSTRQTVEPSVLVLLDESLSMSIRDRYRQPESLAAVAAFTGRTEADIRRTPPSRVELVNQLLALDESAFLRSLTGKGRLQVLSFAETARLRHGLGTASPPSPPRDKLEHGGRVPPLEARGTGTNNGRALREGMQSVAGNRIAAIILIGDGRDTVVEEPRELALRFGRQDIPVFTVPVGDPSEPCNVRVTELWAPKKVPRKDPFSIQARIQVRNADTPRIKVELRRSPANAPDTEPGTIVATEMLDIQEKQTTYSLDFAHKPEQPGRFRYTVTTPVLPEEIVDADNERSVNVEILDHKLRILLVSGGPSWDYRLVSTLLIRDPSVDVSCWLQSLSPKLRQAGTTPLNRFPTTPAELFAYDGIVLMDPNPEQLTEQWLGILHDFVNKHGGGLLWMAGPTYTAQSLTLANGAALRKLLPIRLRDAPPPPAPAGRRSTWTREWRLRTRGAGADHPMLSLTPDPQNNIALWKDMPGIYWYYPVRGATPGARVLMEHAEPALAMDTAGMPLLVQGRVGAGPVIWMGFTDTWCWRRAGEEHFNRFWIQAVRELAAGRILKGRHRAQISTDRGRYDLGATVRVTARFFDSNYRPLVAPLVKARVVSGDGETGHDLDLPAIAGREGVYAGSFAARYLGRNEIRAATPEIAGVQTKPITHRFGVELPNIEFADGRPDDGLLRLLATESGGACLNLDQLTDLPDRIPDRHESLVVQGKAVDLWDTWRVLLILIILLGIEWSVRKRYHLA